MSFQIELLNLKSIGLELFPALLILILIFKDLLHKNPKTTFPNFQSNYPKIFFKLAKITTIPTIIINAFTGNLLDKRAAIGAATIPPRIKPKITCHCEKPMTKMKVKDEESEMKNSAKFTEPIVYFG